MVLNAFDASMSRTPSVSSLSKISFKAWMAASHPASRPVHTWSMPHACWISFFRVLMMAFAARRLKVSPIPIGRMSLSPFPRGISLQARKDVRELGSVNSMQRRFVASAIASQSRLAWPPSPFEQRRALASSESTPEAPAAPFELKAIERIRSPSICSNKHAGTG